MLFGLKILLLLVGTFFTRPTALGEDYASVGIVFFVGAFLIHLFESKFSSSIIEVRTTKQNQIVMAAVLFLYTYLLAHALIMNSINLNDVLKATLSQAIIICTAVFILSDIRTNQTFFRSLIVIFICFVVSHYITIILSFFIPLENMKMFQIHYGNYSTKGETYFPFTILYGFYTVDKLHLPRLLGLFRESGILQMFLIWSLFNLKSLTLERWWVKLIILLGIVGTFSTAGIAILFINFVIASIFRKKFITAGTLALISYLAIFYTPFIGIYEKDNTHGASISDRMQATQEAWASLQQHPFGVGMYNTDLHNSGINLIASSYMIGIFGFVISLLVYLSPLIIIGNKKRFLLSVTPIIITSLFSQPLLDAPLVYIMLMSYYKEERQYSTKKVIPTPKPHAFLKSN